MHLFKIAAAGVHCRSRQYLRACCLLGFIFLHRVGFLVYEVGGWFRKTSCARLGGLGLRARVMSLVLARGLRWQDFAIKWFDSVLRPTEPTSGPGSEALDSSQSREQSGERLSCRLQPVSSGLGILFW